MQEEDSRRSREKLYPSLFAFFSLTRMLGVFVSTWNVGGVLPDGDLRLDDWLDAGNTYDVYVLGFQEAVPLTPKNVISPERRPLSRWNSLIKAALNRSSSSSSYFSSSSSSLPPTGERQKIHPVKDGPTPSRSSSHASPEFLCVASKQMVGILVSVWVRSTLRRRLHHLSVSSVGCGVMGFMGNKGSVSVSFLLHNTSFCFVCCHLASGGKEGDERRRNCDAGKILSWTTFRRRCRPRRILDHDQIILLGDLNYRVSLPEAAARNLARKKEWGELLQRDQLAAEVSDGGVFEGWSEGDVSFLPTYKYYRNSDDYYGCVQGRKGENKRAPAWCDRILWRGMGLRQIRYDRFESRLSDHRPVRAVFVAEVREDPIRELPGRIPKARGQPLLSLISSPPSDLLAPSIHKCP
ncbi:unnamed protein product [Spirodela intermedia]|uniref:Inositol polyphosphate-related phosphatase domain-containing protein n=1 Tax=Spirodela intermedia TaxID=51605 RepID=A0A7I8KEL0_SPIIN|nr:unnamed protein product [Spirodela intermedia]